MDILKKYYLQILVGVLTVLTIGIYGLYCFEKFYHKDSIADDSTSDLAVLTDSEVNDVEEETMYVEVKGQVVTPGVYAVTNRNIINDVIEMAGGFTDYAYTDNINLSKKVSDEMVIVIYSAYEYSMLNKPQVVYVEKPCTCADVDISSCVKQGSSVIEDGSSSSPSDDSNSDSNTQSSLVNINTATQSELESLNGIGEAKASAIISYRSENGNFKSIEEIMNVSGISENLFDKIKDYITV